MKLLLKEIRLAMHPTLPVFWILSAMVFIPDYPYYVIFFYPCLALFFTCLSGRENGDVMYTLMLPVRRRDVVFARWLMMILSQAIQLLLTALFAAVKSKLSMPANNAGIEANAAFFGLSMCMLAAFNMVFLPAYYKNVWHVGKAFILGSSVMFAWIIVMEAGVHILPWMRDVLDTADPMHAESKLSVLLIGVFLYAASAWGCLRLSQKRFETLDL